MVRSSFLDHPGPIAFAHRGGAAERPENTMTAFAGAVALGYRYLELDVRTTADGVLVVFHDDRLDRVTDRTGRLSELPWREVQLARVAGVEPVPRLEEVLATWPDVRVNIDPKQDAAVAPLAEAIHRAGAVDRVCVAAFSDRRLARIRSLVGPQLCTALGPGGIAWLRATSLGAARRRAYAATCVQVPARVGRVSLVDERFVRAAHHAGLPVHVWTVDDPATMGELLDLGVDGIMSDRPAVLREVLEARGRWVG